MIRRSYLGNILQLSFMFCVLFVNPNIFGTKFEFSVSMWFEFRRAFENWPSNRRSSSRLQLQPSRRGDAVPYGYSFNQPKHFVKISRMDTLQVSDQIFYIVYGVMLLDKQSVFRIRAIHPFVIITTYWSVAL